MSTQNALLVFCAVALALLSVLQAARILKGGTFSSNFAKLFGIIVIAALGCALAVTSSLTTEARTAIYTLLGTLAGYLAGARPASGSGGGGTNGDNRELRGESVL
ncbi:hypothetical protein [Nocardioides alcanivorans]|uniref:hypothetical protein n=1 Tax=Nocardioides alcanivorans TaxID=2897352 RepID=UPI001F41CD7A|nr:hypothetical protein [Nocardioides alcanivorans]